MLRREGYEVQVSALRLVPFRGRLAAEHPELDQPDGDITWERWLEGRQRLETALLFQPTEVGASR